MRAKWVTVAPGIRRSALGWLAVWRQTDPASGERVQDSKFIPTKVPPGESEAPPEHVRRYRERMRLEGLEGKRSRRDVPKKNVRAIQVAPVQVASFGEQLQRLFTDAGWTWDEAAKKTKIAKSTIARHMKGEYPTATSRATYKEALEKILERPIRFVVPPRKK